MTIIIYYILCVAADSWPEVFDDSGARNDWDWHHEFDIERLVKVMFDYLNPQYK